MIRRVIVVEVVCFFFVIGILSARAMAPVIEELPSVIIGDAGDVAGSGESARHLFRYTNIINISQFDKITWRNIDLGFTDGQKHAYYVSSPPGAIQVSTDQRMVSELTYADIAAMQTNGTRPAAAKEITDSSGDGGYPDFFWISLANNISGTANAYTATAAADGQPLSAFGGKLDPAVVTLVLADGDFPTTAVAQADFTVYTVPGAEDGYSGAVFTVYEADFDTGSDGWVSRGNDYSIFSPAISGMSGGALTMSIGHDPSRIYYGTWTTGDGKDVETVIPVDELSMEGNIFRATFTITSTAANANNTPGYRLFYESEAFTHLGGISYNSTNSVAGSSPYAPSTAGSKDVILYWAVPFGLTGYSDADKLANVQSGKDYRDYFLAFDMIGYESTDTGVLGLTNVLVERMERPKPARDLVTWGAGGHPFNGSIPVDGWVRSTSDPGIGLGRAWMEADKMNLMATSWSEMGYQAAGPWAYASALPPWQSNKLIRTNVQISSSAVNFSPTFRILTLTARPTGSALSMVWVDAYSSNIPKRLWDPAMAGAAGAPAPDGGSMVESYVWTHIAPIGSDAGILEPMIDCYTTGKTIGVSKDNLWEWPVENARLTISKFQYEECVANPGD